MTDLNKGERREIVALYKLLRHDILQKDLWKFISKQLKENLADGNIDHVLKPLEKKKIIKRKPFKKEGRGANPNLVFIPKNHFTLVNLLNEIYSLKKDLCTSMIKRSFIRSPFARGLINMELVLKILSEIESIINIENFNFVFNDEEKEFILKILRYSPSALRYSTSSCYDDFQKVLESKKWKKLKEILDEDTYLERITEELKKQFIFNLQLHAGEDLSQGIANDLKPVEYKISIKFLPEEEMDIYPKKLSMKIEEDEIESTITNYDKLKVDEFHKN